MSRPGTTAHVPQLPLCDFCKAEGRRAIPVAEFDARTPSGQWAYLCSSHFILAECTLGTGRGQRLITPAMEALAAGRMPRDLDQSDWERSGREALEAELAEEIGDPCDCGCHLPGMLPLGHGEASCCDCY